MRARGPREPVEKPGLPFGNVFRLDPGFLALPDDENVKALKKHYFGGEVPLGTQHFGAKALFHSTSAKMECSSDSEESGKDSGNEDYTHSRRVTGKWDESKVTGATDEQDISWWTTDESEQNYWEELFEKLWQDALKGRSKSGPPA